ncbi:MAG: 3-phosphoshikimate 1-carboxyvinyltransferase [Gammaproteobacteria bacterium]
MATTHDFVIAPGGQLTGRIRVPGDKSICHRALLLGALAKDATHISNFLESTDCLATLHCLQMLGVKIEKTLRGGVAIEGVGVHGLRAPIHELNCGNSGTSIRLLAGLLAGQPFESMLTGDASLRRRPMLRVTEPLTRMGAVIRSLSGCAPLVIHGRRPLTPLRYAIPIASAQVKSGLLLAGLQAEGETWLMEPAKTRDHTERMLASFGCKVLHDGKWLGIRGGDKLSATAIAIPGDLSSAAFFITAAAGQPAAHITLEGIGVNPSRTGVLHVLQAMGADIRLLHRHMLGNEPVADIEVCGGSLQGVDIGPDMAPLVIDELPALLMAAASARGVTTLRGASELRVKESDRLQALATGLRTLGVEVELWDDGIRVTGRQHFQGGVVDSFGDHRIAMAFAMAGLRTHSPLRIRDCRNVDTSFPGFAGQAGRVGLSIDSMEMPTA